MGHGTVASGIHSTAMGKETLASGSFATAMGRNTVAEGTYSLASGLNTQAQGSLSFAAGHETTAQSYAEVVFGRFNALADDSRFKDSPSPHAWSKHDALLRVGVGTKLDRKDASRCSRTARGTADGTIGKCGEEDGDQGRGAGSSCRRRPSGTCARRSRRSPDRARKPPRACGAQGEWRR